MLRPNAHRARYSVALRTSTDAWTHAQSLSGGWAHSYEQLERGPFYGEIREAWLGPVQLAYESVSGPIRYDGRPWQGSRLFFSYLSNRGGLYYDNRLVDANLLTTCRWDAVDRVTSNQASELVLIAIDEDFLDRFTSATVGREFFRRDDGPPVTYTTDPTLVQRFQRSVIETLRVLEIKPALLDDANTRDTIRDRVLNALLSVLVDRTGADARLPPPCTRAYVVDRAIQFIDSRLLGEPVSIADVCTAVRVCPRTLCYSFEAVLGVTPSRYLLATRLNRVRRDILANAGGVPLQNLAARWGLWHMGRFARYYRETFGERPSDTMRAVALKFARRSSHHGRARGLANAAT